MYNSPDLFKRLNSSLAAANALVRRVRLAKRTSRIACNASKSYVVNYNNPARVRTKSDPLVEISASIFESS